MCGCVASQRERGGHAAGGPSKPTHCCGEVHDAILAPLRAPPAPPMRCVPSHLAAPHDGEMQRGGRRYPRACECLCGPGTGRVPSNSSERTSRRGWSALGRAWCRCHVRWRRAMPATRPVRSEMGSECRPNCVLLLRLRSLLANHFREIIIQFDDKLNANEQPGRLHGTRASYPLLPRAPYIIPLLPLHGPALGKGHCSFHYLSTILCYSPTRRMKLDLEETRDRPSSLPR